MQIRTTKMMTWLAQSRPAARRYGPPVVLLAGILHAAVVPGRAAQDQQQEGRTTATAVYNTAQAARGETAYRAVCASCHLTEEHSDDNFRFLWNGRPLFDLVDIIMTTMPQDNPGTLGLATNVDIVAYILKLNGAPAGTDSLGSDSTSLRRIKVELKKGQ